MESSNIETGNAPALTGQMAGHQKALAARRFSAWGRWALAVAVSLALVAGALSPSTSMAGSGQPDRADVDENVRRLAERQPQALLPVLVQRQNDGAALAAIEAHGGKIRHRLSIKHAVAADLPAAKIAALAREPGVTRISFDAPVISQAVGEPVTAQRLATVYPLAVNAAALWTATSRVTGQGVTVAVLDSGLEGHDDFRGAVVRAVDRSPERERGDDRVDGDDRDGSRTGTQVPALRETLAEAPGATRIVRRENIAQSGTADGPGDSSGHGTHVAGIVGGRGWGGPSPADDFRYVGIAPDVRFVAIKVSDRYGLARNSDVIAGILWAVANKDRYGIRVLNISLLSTVSEPYSTSLLDAAVEFAWFKGIVVVVSAGNGGPNSARFPPANDPFVITVGATDDVGTASIADDRLAWFSSYGATQSGTAKPDLVAPGRRIVSTLASRRAELALQYRDRVSSDGRYIRLSGTSMAAPVVSGVAALVLQARPTLTPNEVKALLVHTARPVPGPGTGAGYPDAVAAVRYSGAIPRANAGLVPNRYLALAGYAALTGRTTVSWDTVSWDTVSWDTVSWDTVSWDTVSWDTVSWDTVSWDTVSWDTVSWDSVAGD